jgi:hypothetical protein
VLVVLLHGVQDDLPIRRCCNMHYNRMFAAGPDGGIPSPGRRPPNQQLPDPIRAKLRIRSVAAGWVAYLQGAPRSSAASWDS